MTTATKGAHSWLGGVPFAIKAIQETEELHGFVGLAAAFSQDLGDDVIHPGAFLRTLDHWGRVKERRPIYLIDGHDSWGSVTSVVGKAADARETDEGLEMAFGMVPEDAHADAAFRRVKGGFITSLSIGYTPVRWEYKVDGERRIRHLFEVKLHEVSLVIFPMNEDAVIDLSSVKSLLANGTLTGAEREELRALLAPEPVSSAPPALAPEVQGKLREKLLRLQLRHLATRASGPARRGL